MTTGSDEAFLRFYESYRRAPKDELNSLPRARTDYRQRVERETIRGRYGVFHETIEMYINRQWRAYTCPRVAVFWLGSFALMQHAYVAFDKAFPNLESYPSFRKHPQYKILGPAYSWFYMLRPVFWTYICYRMTRLMYHMVTRHLEGKDDQHYFQYYDTNFPDLILDAEGQHVINFRYTDQQVQPEDMTGYYPYDHMKYHKWLAQKEDSRFTTKADLQLFNPRYQS